MLGDGLGVAACAGHDLDVGLPAVGKVDMIRPHSVADYAFSFSQWSRQLYRSFLAHVYTCLVDGNHLGLLGISHVWRLPQRLSREPTNRTDDDAGVPDTCGNVIVAWDGVLVQEHLVGPGAAVEFLPRHVYGL